MENDTENSNDPLIQQFKADFRTTERVLRAWRKEARENYEFVAGHQINDQDRAILEEELRPVIVFNRIDPVISAVSGYMINNQTMLKYFPRTQGDAKPNELYSEAARWVDDESDANDEITDSFWDLLITGVGCTETRLDYDDDIEGKIYGADRVPPLECGWDTTAKKRNMADARFQYRVKWWKRKDAEMRWPKVKNISPGDEDMWRDEDPGEEEHDATEAWRYENDSTRWFDAEKDQVMIVQYQYWRLEPVYIVGDPGTGRLIEFDEKRYARLRDRIEAMGLRVLRQLRKKYRQAFIVGEQVLEDDESPCPHSFTLRFMTGKRDEVKKHWYGLVRGMKDPQTWSNKFFSEIENIMTSNRTGGAFVEETALVDPRKAEEEWNDPNPLIILRDGAVRDGAVMERNPIQYPQGMDRLMQIAIQALPQTSGINPEMMGLVDREQPGVLEMQRKRAGMTILASLFASLRRYQKERGRVLLYFIQEYISDGRLIRVTTDEGEKYMPLVKQMDHENSRFDTVVGDAPTSPNQREETFAVLTTILPQILKMGVPIPPKVLDFLPLPQDLIDEWKTMITKPDPKADQEKDLKLRETAAKADKDEATAELNRMKALVERMEARLKPVETMMRMTDEKPTTQ